MNPSMMVQMLIWKGMWEAAMKEYLEMWQFPVDNSVKGE